MNSKNINSTMPDHIVQGILLSQLRKLDDAKECGLPALRALAFAANDERRQRACKSRSNYERRVDAAGDAWIVNIATGAAYLQGMSREGEHSYLSCMCGDHAYTYAINRALVEAGGEPLVTCKHGHLSVLLSLKPKKPAIVSRPVHATYPPMVPFLAHTPTSGEVESDFRQAIEAVADLHSMVCESELYAKAVEVNRRGRAVA